jgi:hypothetical protein
MPIHAWTRVGAGTFHDFHQAWTIAIRKANRIVIKHHPEVGRAAHDAALQQGIPIGGWLPRVRSAQDGPLDPTYPLVEMPTVDYPGCWEVCA